MGVLGDRRRKGRAKSSGNWCRERDSNSHAPRGAADFKSAMSTCSIIPALGSGTTPAARVSNRLALPVRRAQSGTWGCCSVVRRMPHRPRNSPSMLPLARRHMACLPPCQERRSFPRLGRPRALPGQALGPQSGEARRRHRVTSGAPGGSVPRIPLLSRRHATAHLAARLKLDQRIEQVDRRERTSRMCVFGPVTLWKEPVRTSFPRVHAGRGRTAARALAVGFHPGRRRSTLERNR